MCTYFAYDTVATTNNCMKFQGSSCGRTTTVAHANAQTYMRYCDIYNDVFEM